MAKYWCVQDSERKCDTCKHNIVLEDGVSTKCEYFPPCVGFAFKWEPKNPENYSGVESFEVDEPEQFFRYGDRK